MAWLISRALMEVYESSLCSQAQAAEYLGANCSGGEPSALSSSSPTQDAYSSPDRMTVLSRLSRFGMTFAPLTVDRGEDVLMWFLGVSRAKTLAAPERVQDSKALGLDSGWRWSASFARFDPGSSSWKTRQCSLAGGLELYSETWPRWGTMRNGECLERTTLAPPIGASVSGLSAMLPTPAASDRGGFNRGGAAGRVGPIRPGLVMMARDSMWPTPTARDWKSGKASQQTMDRNSRPLSEVVYHREMWQTPVADDSVERVRGKVNSRGGAKLSGQVLDGKTTAQVGGQLNPMWVEWLQGWPLGHTDFAPLATDKCHSAPQWPGDCSPSEGAGHE